MKNNMRTIKFRFFVEDIRTGHWDYGEVMAGEELWIPNEVEIINQFTGLLDKNGKEIYEGDIIKTDQPWRLPMLVQWNDKYARFGLVVKMFAVNSPTLGNYRNCIEVIGNIYENPELIKN